MAYEPKTWQCGEVVSADALNHLEQGVADAGGGSAMIVRMDTEGTTDKTWQEVYDALIGGTLVCVLSSLSSTPNAVTADVVAHAPILMAVGGNNNYGAVMMSISTDGTSARTIPLVADSADGYLRAATGGTGGGQ